ncbi:uncharacterized protein N7506_000002 [Penicillium brevicompactum]|uniref:uncharacterized protein n=1 Tax=Penicillium brevicompactum TaxID=5074 RepID=UPI0025414712|nr:uncharacterized protein N7506_000002 [Penicillium brevicompactum]KAJ5346749.1 hypothetical protein N7506_000002 [Penicillium brevicompactum]
MANFLLLLLFNVTVVLAQCYSAPVSIDDPIADDTIDTEYFQANLRYEGARKLEYICHDRYKIELYRKYSDNQQYPKPFYSRTITAPARILEIPPSRLNRIKPEAEWEVDFVFWTLDLEGDTTKLSVIPFTLSAPAATSTSDIYSDTSMDTGFPVSQTTTEASASISQMTTGASKYLPEQTTLPEEKMRNEEAGSGGLSDGAKAGIGVGVSVGVLLLLGGAFFWFLAWKRKPSNKDETNDAS